MFLVYQDVSEGRWKLSNLLKRNASVQLIRGFANRYKRSGIFFLKNLKYQKFPRVIFVQAMLSWGRGKLNNLSKRKAPACD